MWGGVGGPCVRLCTRVVLSVVCEWEISSEVLSESGRVR